MRKVTHLHICHQYTRTLRPERMASLDIRTSAIDESLQQLRAFKLPVRTHTHAGTHARVFARMHAWMHTRTRTQVSSWSKHVKFTHGNNENKRSARIRSGEEILTMPDVDLTLVGAKRSNII